MDEEVTGSEQPRTDETEILENTGDFVLSLIQALLRTGYYLSEHPESKKAKAGLHEKFAAIVGKEGELSFLIKDEKPSANIYVEGVLNRPLRLTSFMSRGMADTYTPRFISFLQRKELLSLSLNGRMSAEEFSSFIDIMSEPSLAEMGDQTVKEKFVAALRDKQVFNLSFVFSEDFIAVRSGLPWRTRMALSRLKKDLHMLPIFRNLPEEEHYRVKQQILGDILRPLEASDLIYSFILNLDLAISASLTEEEGEEGVFAAMNERTLVAVGEFFLRDASSPEAGFPEHVTADKKSRLLGKLCHRLSQTHNPAAGKVLEEMFNQGLLSLEELSPRLREQVMLIRWITGFLNEPGKYLRALGESPSVEVFTARGRTFVKSIPFLVERNRFDEAIRIVESLRQHCRSGEQFSEAARKVAATIYTTELLDRLVKAFLTSPKEIRLQIGRLFTMVGKAAVPHLFRIISTSADVWRRKQAVEILISLGESAALSLIDALQQGTLPPESIPPVLKLLRSVKDPTLRQAAAQVMAQLFEDPQLPIRREAVAGLCRLQPTGHYDLFRIKADDPDTHIARSALTGAGLSGDKRGFELFTLVIEKGLKGEKRGELLATAAVEGLGNLLDLQSELRGQGFAYLENLVARLCPASRWKQFLGATGILPVNLSLALVELLGRKECPESAQLLARFARHRDKIIADRSTELLAAWQAKGPK